MLELRHIEDKEALRSFCLSFKQPFTNKLEAYAAFCGGGAVGVCFFTIEDELLLRDAIIEEEYGAELCDGLVRAVLNYAELHGVVRAKFAEGFNEKAKESLHRFGFKQNVIEDIDKFLTGCKSCSNNTLL